MANSSSTSSFDDPSGGFRFPRALLIALVLIAGVEVVVRMLGPDRMLAYDLGRMEYIAAANRLRQGPAADVCFLGSSRGREAILLTQVRETLARGCGQDFTAENYSFGGARAGECLEVIKTILEWPDRPRMIVFGVSPRILLGTSRRRTEMAQFWSWEDLVRNREGWGDFVNLMPIVIRNRIGEWYWTLRYRERLSAAVTDLQLTLRSPTDDRSVQDALLFRPIPMPPTGGRTKWQRVSPDQSLENTPVPEERVERYVARLLTDGRYVLNDDKVEQLRAAVRLCREAGVPLVFVELPMSSLLTRHFPEGTTADFLSRMRSLSGEEGFVFVTLEELELSFTDADFLEQSHLNSHGSRKLSRAIAEQVLRPRLCEGHGTPR